MFWVWDLGLMGFRVEGSVLVLHDKKFETLGDSRTIVHIFWLKRALQL